MGPRFGTLIFKRCLIFSWLVAQITAVENISRNGPRNCRSPFDFAQGRLSAAPDFLSNLVALAIFMRLSLLKGAHAVLSSAAWQEIRVRSP